MSGKVDFCSELQNARWSWAPVPQQHLHWFQWILCNGGCLLQTSKLVLTSKRDGSALAATMVFALRAEVDARGPLKRFKADAQLYEFKEFEVKLTNPFQVKPTALEDAWQHWLHPRRVWNLQEVHCPKCTAVACQILVSLRLVPIRRLPRGLLPKI